jgi:hypothetical protein
MGSSPASGASGSDALDVSWLPASETTKVSEQIGKNIASPSEFHSGEKFVSHSRGDNATRAYRRSVCQGQPPPKPQMAPSRQLDEWTPDRAREPVLDQEMPEPV